MQWRLEIGAVAVALYHQPGALPDFDIRDHGLRSEIRDYLVTKAPINALRAVANELAYTIPRLLLALVRDHPKEQGSVELRHPLLVSFQADAP